MVAPFDAFKALLFFHCQIHVLRSYLVVVIIYYTGKSTTNPQSRVAPESGHFFGQSNSKHTEAHKWLHWFVLQSTVEQFFVSEVNSNVRNERTLRAIIAFKKNKCSTRVWKNVLHFLPTFDELRSKKSLTKRVFKVCAFNIWFCNNKIDDR